jgi:hypothetical protein
MKRPSEQSLRFLFLLPLCQSVELSTFISSRPLLQRSSPIAVHQYMPTPHSHRHPDKWEPSARAWFHWRITQLPVVVVSVIASPALDEWLVLRPAKVDKCSLFEAMPNDTIRQICSAVHARQVFAGVAFPQLSTMGCYFTVLINRQRELRKCWSKWDESQSDCTVWPAWELVSSICSGSVRLFSYQTMRLHVGRKAWRARRCVGLQCLHHVMDARQIFRIPIDRSMHAHALLYELSINCAPSYLFINCSQSSFWFPTNFFSMYLKIVS